MSCATVRNKLLNPSFEPAWVGYTAKSWASCRPNTGISTSQIRNELQQRFFFNFKTARSHAWRRPGEPPVWTRTGTGEERDESTQTPRQIVKQKARQPGNSIGMIVNGTSKRTTSEFSVRRVVLSVLAVCGAVGSSLTVSWLLDMVQRWAMVTAASEHFVW